MIRKYFPELNAEQFRQFEMLPALYEHWNSKINVISRKDAEHLTERHVLHSLGIAKVISFNTGSRILDVGTGGGFPGVPLAIMFPGSEFTLVDSIGKKIKVVNEVIGALGLKNCKAIQARAEDLEQKFDFVVSRAVTAFPRFYSWVRGKFLTENLNMLPNGILYLKGGDLSEELGTYKDRVKEFNLSEYFDEEFFVTKKVLYMPVVAERRAPKRSNSG